MPVTGEPGAGEAGGGADQGVILVTTAHWTGLERRENVVRDLTVFGWLGQITLHRTQADTCCTRLHQAWCIVVGKYI